VVAYPVSTAALPSGYRITGERLTKRCTSPVARQLDQQGKVHLLLALYPLVKLDQAYKVVYEKVLNEKISTQTVSEPQ